MTDPPPRSPSVRQFVARLWVANLALILFIALVGVVAVWRSTDTVDYVTGAVQPVTAANAQLATDVTAAESHVRAWGLSGSPDRLRDYRAVLNEIRVDQVHLSRQQTGDARLAGLIDKQDEAIQAWVTEYAEKRLAGEPGIQNADADLLQAGLDRIRDVRSANRSVVQRLGELAGVAQDEADVRLRRTLVILGAAALAALGVGIWIAGRVRRGLVAPLVGMEDTVVRMTDGEHGARAEVAGPSEVRRVASALNVLAEENERARQVETAVIEQLRALDSIKTDFVFNVSHELRTPLTSISGYVELLEEELGDRLTEDEREMIVAAKRNVSRLKELIEDLLTLSRAESRGTDLQQVDLEPLLVDVVNDVSVSASQRGVDVLLHRPVEPVVVLADPSQITRAVMNLVTNAVKYSNGAAEVDVVLARSGTDAVIEVRDRGIGIPSGEMAELGSRFYRASNAVNLAISGTGLGLRIVQAIMENHRGSLEIDSQEGHGTTARMRLPLRAHLDRPVGSGSVAREQPGGRTG